MKNVGFYYQVWHTNKLSIFEAMKRLRSVYPDNEVVLVIAGLSKDSVTEYENDFVNIIKSKFNITTIDYLFIEDSPYMAKCILNVPEQESKREEYMKFSHLWFDKFVFLPSEYMDVVVNCSDDWYPITQIPIDYDVDVCGRLTPWSDWMEEEKMKSKFNFSKNELVTWIQHGHYMNIKKLKQKYTEENKKYIDDVVRDVFPSNLPIFLDYFHSLWNVVAFDTFKSADHIHEVGAFKINYEEDNHGFPSIHGGKGLHFLPISEEMIQLGIK